MKSLYHLLISPSFQRMEAGKLELQLLALEESQAGGDAVAGGFVRLGQMEVSLGPGRVAYQLFQFFNGFLGFSQLQVNDGAGIAENSRWARLLPGLLEQGEGICRLTFVFGHQEGQIVQGQHIVRLLGLDLAIQGFRLGILALDVAQGSDIGHEIEASSLLACRCLCQPTLHSLAVWPGSEAVYSTRRK